MKEAHVVTGGIGFIGVNVCKALLEQGDSVVAVDNLSTAHIENLAVLRAYKNFHFIHADVTTLTHLDFKALSIWHLACPASPPFYQADPIHTMMTCVVGTKNMLDLAVTHGCKLLFTSTSEVYGDPSVHPQPEDYRGNVAINGIRSCYDEGKRAAESLCCDYTRVYGVDVRLVRLFNTYGTGMSASDGRVISNFIMQALNGKDITIYGDGSQTRSLCYVSDTVAALQMVMDAEENHGVLNIGNPVEKTVLQIAEIIIQLTVSRSKLVFKELPSDDPRQRCPDTTRIEDCLGWKETVPLDLGLINTIAYFKTQ